MYRVAIEKLLKWKQSKRRKPLIIEGARQVGKTWLMKEFGRQSYADTVYINFDSNSRMAELFASDLDTDRLIMGLELYVGHKIDPNNSLLVFDEVQEVPRALASLKYFYENAPQYHIVCAGSLLGIALHQGTSFPVGKVDFLKLYPLSFKEFLMATGKEQFAALLDKQDFQMITSFKQTYIDALKHYYFVGGMPEAVQSFAENKDFNEVREIQKRILAAYEQDFSKHAPNEIVPRLRMLWNSVPSQLAKENKKFIYGLVREGARAKDYETALLWLSDCGLVHKVSRVNTVGIPLRAYVVGAEKRRPVLNILQRRRFCAAVNKEQEEITGDTPPASSRPYRPDAIPLCRCCASGRADRAAAPCADTRFLFRAARFAGQRAHDWQNSA